MLLCAVDAYDEATSLARNAADYCRKFAPKGHRLRFSTESSYGFILAKANKHKEAIEILEGILSPKGLSERLNDDAQLVFYSSGESIGLHLNYGYHCFLISEIKIQIRKNARSLSRMGLGSAAV